MRKVFKEDFAIFQKGINIGRIDWVNSVGRNIRFIYDGIEGIINIKELIDNDVVICYNGESTTMHISQFRKGQLGSFLNVYTKNYKYNIGDIINNNIILEQIRVKQGKGTSKGYKYKCLKCEYLGETTEVSMHRLVCPVCSNSKVIKGINDIATTHPHLISQFANIEDAYVNTWGGGERADFCCPDCGFIKNMKIYNFIRNGIQCNKCSDGASYPNKFVLNVLEQLEIQFKPEKIFKWSNNKRYDFYLIALNAIIEVMGNQHFEKSFNFCGGRNTLQEQKNDIIKEELAHKNNIKEYIIINCRKSELELMKNSILESKLSNFFDLSNIDWLKCEEFALSNRVKVACELWNKGCRPPEIKDMMKISTSTVWKYLTKGTVLNWCKYDSNWNIEILTEAIKSRRSKQVEVYKNNQLFGIFQSVAELSRQSENLFGIKFSQSQISNVCLGKCKIHKGYIFKYSDIINNPSKTLMLSN